MSAILTRIPGSWEAKVITAGEFPVEPISSVFVHPQSLLTMLPLRHRHMALRSDFTDAIHSHPVTLTQSASRNVKLPKATFTFPNSSISFAKEDNAFHTFEKWTQGLSVFLSL